MQTIPIYNFVKISALSLGVLQAGQTGAVAFSLNPSADSFVAAGPAGNLSSNNYGMAGALSVAASGLAQGEFQSVMQFGLSVAKASFDSQYGAGQWSIQSVTLQLTAAPPNNGIFNASAAGQFGISLMLNNGWTEGSGTPQMPGTNGITFSTLSNFESPSDEALGSFSFNGATNGAVTYNLNLSPTLAADISAGGSASMRLFADDTSVSYLFNSRNIGTPSSRPLLTINAVPEPNSLALGALGLGLLAVGMRRYTGERNRLKRRR